MKIEIPFSEVRPGEQFESRRTKRFIVGIKTKPIEVKNEMSAGQHAPLRNAVIIKVGDSGVDSIGAHIFEEDDLVVVVDRPLPSGS